MKAERLPVNRPHATEAHTYHRDGVLRFDGNGGGSVNYEPNSFGGPVEDARFKEPQHSTRVAAAGRALKSSRRTLVWVGKTDASAASESDPEPTGSCGARIPAVDAVIRVRQ